MSPDQVRPLTPDEEKVARAQWREMPYLDEWDGEKETNVLRAWGHYGGEWADRWADGLWALLDAARADAETLRRAVNESAQECEPGCDRFGHDDHCPRCNPAQWLADQQQEIEQLRADAERYAAERDEARSVMTPTTNDCPCSVMTWASLAACGGEYCCPDCLSIQRIRPREEME